MIMDIQTKQFYGLIFLFFFLLHPLSIKCQDFARIDSIAMNAPDLATRSLDDLAAYCQANAESELEKVRFYFVWIARNIRYDERMSKVPSIEFDQKKQSPQHVFRIHKAICTGYSRLFVYLCQISKIPVFYVAGYGKEDIRPDSIQTHAWNVVKVAGEWALFDPTWASNSLANDSSDLNLQFERYFMGSPDVFQKGHLPYDPAFQLTKDMMTRQEFFKNTEGDDAEKPEKPEEDFATLLNREHLLDSLSLTILSHRRGLAFMPEDSNIVVKLRGALKEKQFKAVKEAHDVLTDFSKSAEKSLEQLSIYVLKEWSDRFEKIAEPLQTAIETNREIEKLEIKEEKITEAKQSRQQIFDLIGYFSQSWNQVKEEMGKRN
jgi:hypothetical protein